MDSARKPLFDPDPVIEFYKKDVDRTLIRENPKLTVTERFEKQLRRAGHAARPPK